MRMSRLRVKMAAVAALLMGLPVVETARADSGVGDIVGGVFSLIFGIVDVAGDS